MKKDIDNDEDIRLLVDSFYKSASSDVLLGTIFSRIGNSDVHKQTLYAYWSNVLLNKAMHDHHEFPRHVELMFSRRHFIRWLNLFLETIDTHYAGPTAERAKVMVIRKSEEFQSKLKLSRF